MVEAISGMDLHNLQHGTAQLKGTAPGFTITFPKPFSGVDYCMIVRSQNVKNDLPSDRKNDLARIEIPFMSLKLAINFSSGLGTIYSGYALEKHSSYASWPVIPYSDDLTYNVTYVAFEL